MKPCTGRTPTRGTRGLLNELALTAEGETEVICSAIWRRDGEAEAKGWIPVLHVLLGTWKNALSRLRRQ